MPSRWTEAGAGGPVRRLLLLARPRRPEPLPARFDRRRTYVLPTAFGLFFLVLLLTMGVGALNYNNNPALLLCLVLTGTALASLVAAHLQLSGLVVQAVNAEPVAAGKPLLLRVHVRADPRRPRRGLLVRAGDDAAALSLDRGAGEAALELATERRGWDSLCDGSGAEEDDGGETDETDGGPVKRGDGECCADGDCLCHGPEPTALTSGRGPFKTDQFRISTGTVTYPTDAEPPSRPCSAAAWLPS